MPLLDIQRRGQQIGRIRLGEKVKTATGGERPSKLNTFRLTTGSRLAAKAVAELLGGEIKPWEKNQFEIVTERSELAVIVPPRDQVISQWYEQWTAAGCARRCDSVTEKISGKPCLCPQPDDPADPDDVERTAIRRAELAKDGRACSAITRLNVMIPDLPGLGVWRLDTKSHFAAIEMGDAADLLEMARDHGVFLPAILRIDDREIRTPGEKPKQFIVPVLEVSATFRQIASGELTSGGVAAQLPPAPTPARQAITAGAKPAVEKPTPAKPAAVKVEPAPTAQQLADRAARATTKQEINAAKAAADEHLLAEDMVNTSPDLDQEVFEQLDTYLKARWQELPDATQKGEVA